MKPVRSSAPTTAGAETSDPAMAAPPAVERTATSYDLHPALWSELENGSVWLSHPPLPSRTVVRISQKVHPGSGRLYARVLVEGVVRPGDPVENLDSSPSSWR